MNVIADVAGRLDELMELVNLMPDDELVFVGDLNDRGPKSKEVIEFVMNNNHICVQSNHGDMFVDYCNGADEYGGDTFIYNGGLATLKSYGWNPEEYRGQPLILWANKHIPREHVKWLANLPLSYEKDNVIITHAAYYPEYKYFDQIWNREEPNKIEGKLQLFGHNSHWGLTYFRDGENPWAICLDTTRYKVLTGYNTKTKQIYQVEYRSV